MENFAYFDDLADDAEILPSERVETALKFVGDGRVGGYLVVWGNPAQRDLQGEYFTPETELGLDWYESRPALFHHGLDGSLKAAVIGVIDTLKADETGVWAEAQLDMRQRYVQTILKLIEQGALGWSSGSLPHLVEIAKDGRIKRWPIVEGSMTPTPAEPRRTDIRSIKSAILALDTSEQDEAKESTTEEPPPANEPSSEKPNEEPPRVKTMNLQQIIEAMLGILLKAKPDWQLTDEEKAALVQAVNQEMQAGTPPSDAPIEGAALNAVSDKAGELLMGKMKAFFAEREAAAAHTQNMLELSARKTIEQFAQPQSQAGLFAGVGNGAGQGNGQGGNGSGQQQIIVRSEYHDWSAQDMAYLHTLRNPSNSKKGWNPDQKFWRELADKTLKAIAADDVAFAYLPQEGYEDDDTGQAITNSAIKALRAIKADEVNYSTQAGFGDEWVPDLWRSELWPRVRRENVVAQQFQIFDMPTNPWNIPLEAGDPVVRRVPETKNAEQMQVHDETKTPIPSSKIGTDFNQLTAYKLGLRVPISAELQEDAKPIVDVISAAREQSMRAMLDAIDYVLLNADNTVAGNPSGNINRYDAAVLATELDNWLLGWDGVLHLPLVDDTAMAVDGSNAAPTLAMFRSTQVLLDEEYMDDSPNLVWFVDPRTHQRMKNFNEFLTMDKIGDKATILTGQVGSLDGIPVLSTNQIKRAAANGKRSNTNSNNVRGRAALVYKPYWAIGYRRRIKSWVKFDEEYDVHQLGVTVRIAFKKRNTTGMASLLYNLAV